MDNSYFVHKGWLVKRSKYLGKWRKRYATVTSTYLSTYKIDNINEQPTEMIPLKYCSFPRSCEEKMKKFNSFYIKHKDETFYFQADTQEEKQQWVTALQNVISCRRKSANSEQSIRNDL